MKLDVSKGLIRDESPHFNRTTIKTGNDLDAIQNKSNDKNTIGLPFLDCGPIEMRTIAQADCHDTPGARIGQLG